MMQACVVFVIVGTLLGVGGYPHGAPAGTCENMTPHHDKDIPRDDDSPYFVEVSQTSFNQGDVLSVTMSSGGGQPFMGFLLEAREIGKEGNIGAYVGSFSPADHTKLIPNCGNGVSVLTHVDAYKWSFYNLTVQWTAPDSPSLSHIVFGATFVQSFSVFWVDVRSHMIEQPIKSEPPIVPVIKPPEPSADVIPGDMEGEMSHQTEPVSTTPQPIPLQTTVESRLNMQKEQTDSLQNKITSPVKSSVHGDCGRSHGCLVDVECGRSKGCFVDCDSYGCDYVISWVDRGDAVDFEIVAQMQGHGDQWVAIGFSTDIEMGDDGVVECVSQSGVVSVYQSYNSKYYNELRPQPTIGLNKTGGSLSNGLFWCKFMRLKKISEDDVLTVFDLNKPWIIMFASGEFRDGEKQMHNLSPKYGPWTSRDPVDFSKFTVAGRGQGSFVLVKLHGCLMIVAWIICASIGVLVARYYRSEWNGWRPWGNKMWFLIHRSCLVVTFLCVIVSFFVIFEESSRGFGPISNGRQTKRLFESVHPPIGLAAVILAVINPVMALFRPEPDQQYRVVFNWFHRVVGALTFGLAGCAVFFGLGMEKAGVPELGLYVMLGYGIYQSVVIISLEICRCLDDRLTKDIYLKDRSGGAQTEYMSLIKNGLQGENIEDFEEESVWTWKAIFFIGNGLILTAVGIFLMVLLLKDFY